MATYFPAAILNSMVTGAYPTATTFYGGLNTASPATTGANEAIADYTTRPGMNFATPSGGVAATNASATWTVATGFTAAYFSFWNQATVGGTYDGGGILGASLAIPSSTTVIAPTGTITVTANG